MKKILNYIGGEHREAKSGEWLNNFNPAIGEVYSQLPRSDHQDVELAVQAAEKAFPVWSQMPVDERSAKLIKLANLIGQYAQKFALAESIDNGKPVSLASTVDIPRAESNIRFFATAIIHFASEAHVMDTIAVNYTHRKPIGIVGCISPWNLPLYLFTWKIAPALAAGNCVVAKPSEITPMTAYMLSELCNEAGIPGGVLNILHGLGGEVGAAIVAHPKIKAISFTGGTQTGAAIARQAAPEFKKLSLELGGKNPNLIFADADLDEAVSTAVRSSFANQGQICLCGSRIFVEKPVYETFKTQFVAKVKRITPGDPQDPNTKMGAVVSEPHMRKVLEYIELAKQEGGTILTGGKQFIAEGKRSKGYYIEPTIIEGLPYNCRTNQEEIFGPVVTIMPFETEEEVLKMANGVRYGLSATLWTNNLKRAHRLAAQLDTGIVWVNCWLLRDLRTPFGGTKDSGVGREGGFEALRFFTESQNVCIRL